MSELTPLPDTDLARAATYARQALAPAYSPDPNPIELI